MALPPKNRTKTRFTCLILEDDRACAETLARLVRDEKGETVICATVHDGAQAVEEQHFDLFLLDHILPDGTGAAFYQTLRDQGLPVTAIMLTGRPDLPTAVALTRNGLFDYVVKPFATKDLLPTLRRAILRVTQLDLDLTFPEFVGRSPAWAELCRLVREAAAQPEATVLLTGETGVGKDVTAQIIHQLTHQSGNRDAPIVSLNCATLPSEIFESELFGAEKGAYTGAYHARPGLVEAASGGTLFLDEIGEVPLALQPKLLHFLETHSYRRLGGTQPLQFQGRVLAATNRSLEEEVQEGRFRADLLYRLDVFRIHLAPLRERREDILPLTELLLEKLAAKYQRHKPILRTEDAALLESYNFPGNVRELRNLLERSLLRTHADTPWLQLDPGILRRIRSSAALVPADPPAPAPQSEVAPVVAVAPLPSPGPPTVPVTSPAADEEPVPAHLNPLEAHEYCLIRKTLKERYGVMTWAAQEMGMTLQSLRRRVDKWPELRRWVRRK